MTASTAKGTLITNLEAAPLVQGARGQTGGKLEVAYMTNTVATTSIDEVDDIFLALPLPSGARMFALKIYNDDMDSNGSPTLAVDWGGYYGPDVLGQSSGTAIDVNNIATADTTLQAANTAGVNLIYEANDIANVGKPLWEVLGLTSDPGGTVYIGFKVTAVSATPVAGTLTLIAQYI